MDAQKLNERPGSYVTRAEVEIPHEWLAEFEAAAERPLESLSLETLCREIKF